MRIRPFRPADAPAVTQLTECCFENSIRPFYTETGALLFHTYVFPQQICERASQGALLLVAEEEGCIIGVAELRDGNHLSMFFTAPEFQNCGIGRKLLERLWKLAKKSIRRSGISPLTPPPEQWKPTGILVLKRPGRKWKSRACGMFL